MLKIIFRRVQDMTGPPERRTSSKRAFLSEREDPTAAEQAEMNAGRIKLKHIFRALGLLRNHRVKVTLFVLLSLANMILPFVVGAAFGPLLQVLALAAVSGQWDDVWSLKGSLYA